MAAGRVRFRGREPSKIIATSAYGRLAHQHSVFHDRGCVDPPDSCKLGDADGTDGAAGINLVTLLEKPVITAAKLVIGGSGW